MSLADTPVTGSASTMHDGRIDVLQAGRYHRFALSASGVCEIEAVVPRLRVQGEE